VEELLLSVTRVSDVSQIEIHKAESAITDPSPFEVEISTAKLKRYCHDSDYDSRRGFGLDIGPIDHFNIQFVITIMAPSLISTLYSSPEHMLSLFQPALSSPIVT
jgi:hypothetical protein